MVKYRNVFGDEYSGSVAKTGVFAKWKGRLYRRKWVKPSNPRTPAQTSVRSSFANAVQKYQGFNPYQKQAYEPLTAGLVMSAYNLFISRWQKMSEAERAAYQDPKTCIKQVGAGSYSDEKTISTVGGQLSYTASGNPLVVGKSSFDKGTGNLDPVGIVDLRRGRVDMLKSLSGELKITYTSGGKEITSETLKTNPSAGDVLYTRYFPIDPQSSKLILGSSDQHTLEVDVVKSKFYVTYPSDYTSGGTIKYRDYTPVEAANILITKANTQFITYRGYTDENGMVFFAQTYEDGNRDMKIEAPGYQTIVRANQAVAVLCDDEYIALTAL